MLGAILAATSDPAAVNMALGSGIVWLLGLSLAAHVWWLDRRDDRRDLTGHP